MAEIDEIPQENPPAAVSEPEIVPDPAKHILVDVWASGAYALLDQPKYWDRDYRLRVDGRNVEHVGEDVNGVWQYRGM